MRTAASAARPSSPWVRSAPQPRASVQLVLAGLQDADPLVRAAAVESMGRWGEASEANLSGLAPLLEDANDQVKVEAIKALPKLAGATPAVIDGLCRRLLEDDSARSPGECRPGPGQARARRPWPREALCSTPPRPER